MRIARVEIAAELLLAALHLPPDVKLGGDDVAHGTITLYMAHAGLRDVEPGKDIPDANPQLRREEDGTITFVGWGQ